MSPTRAVSGSPMNRAARADVWLPMRRTIAAAATLAWLIAAGPAAADCDPAGPIEEALPDAPIAFVGTVAALDGPIATFSVSEVWAGDVAEVVTVRGLSDEADGRGGMGGGFSEDDRLWVSGETYLVLPIVDRGALRDHICTATTEWRPELERLRPDDARFPAAGPASEGAQEPPVALIAVAVVLVMVAGASVLAFRRR